MIVIRNGEVLTERGWVNADVAIDGTRVVEVGTGLTGDDEIDATGCLVGPGFVDMHTHLREPGETWKEDIASGSRAAVSGGFTAVTAMPNTDPPVDTVEIVELVLTAAREAGVLAVLPSAALTVGRAGQKPSDIEALYRAGVRLFTDDGDSVAEPSVMEEVMSRAARLPGAVVAQHAEDVIQTRGGHMHESTLSRELAVGGLPVSAEAEVVARDLELVSRTGARYHCQHVSAADTVDLLRRARETGLAVTAEVTPHHLSFDVARLADLNPNFKMYPPLRESSDRITLIEAVRSGVIDAVATDHAPHLPAEKAVPFQDAPRGVIGLETAASAVWMALGDRDILFSALSSNPARILGLTDHGQSVRPGITANLVVFDPEARWIAGSFVSKSSNSPYLGGEMKGQVQSTVYEGELVHVRQKEKV